VTDRSISWQCLPFAQLCGAQVYAMLKLRSEVFVVEQQCVYLDADGEDAKAWHVMDLDAQDALMAYARFFAPGLKYAEACIGRVLTAPTARGTGLGRELMQQCIHAVQQSLGEQAIRISAQHHLQAFYESLGFAPQGDVYLEDGIPHIEMLRAS
jgi:ElaA protein